MPHTSGPRGLALLVTGCLASVAGVTILADGPARPPITGLAHLAFYVHDIAKARTYYKEFLGYGEPFSLDNADGTLALTFIKINDRQYLELFPEREAGSDRLAHIGFETDDVEAMRRYLEAQGVAVPPKVNTGRIGNLSFNVKDPDGHTVEFVQYQPASWTTREHGRFMPAAAISPTLRHAGILAGSVEASLAFYRDVLGFRETWRGSRDDKILNWVNLQVPEGDDYLELMLYQELPAPGARGSQHHVCLEVPDVAATVATLEQRRLAVGYTRPLDVRTGINRRRQLNVFDPDGTRTEVMEPRTVDGSPTPSSSAPPPRR